MYWSKTCSWLSPKKTKGKLITRQHVLLDLNVIYNLNTRQVFYWTIEASSQNTWQRSAIFHTVTPSNLPWPKTNWTMQTFPHKPVWRRGTGDGSMICNTVSLPFQKAQCVLMFRWLHLPQFQLQCWSFCQTFSVTFIQCGI